MSATPFDFDAIVIGAGFSGLRMLHELRRLGLGVHVYEAGSDVGGTWYWNSYPGARTDSDAWFYCFDFDDDLLQEWDWPERYPTQEQALGYLRHVTDRFDMRRDIEFDTRVVGAVYDETRNGWTVTTESGEQRSCRYLIAASGLLSVAYEPPFPGVDTFAGESLMTSRWPAEPVTFAGKRVAVVGTGSTGIQIIPVVAETAEHLTVLQRTPNYVIPARNYVVNDQQREAIKRDYRRLWDQAYGHFFGLPLGMAGRVLADVPDEAERRRIFDAAWEQGGLRFLFDTFDDLLVNQASNDAAAEFVRDKIRTIVKDKRTAELLCPQDHPLGGKRPPLGHSYYEAFNRTNVSLVDVKANPIVEVTPKGFRLADGTEHDVDVIIYAMGFDAVTGALVKIDVRGRRGRSIREVWQEESPQQHFGLCGADFPNLFTLAGPQGPIGNFLTFAGKQAQWVASAIGHTQEHGFDCIEVSPDTAKAWAHQCDTLLEATLMRHQPGASSWLTGTNIPGNRPRVMIYLGGISTYVTELQASIESGFDGYTFTRSRELVDHQSRAS